MLESLLTWAGQLVYPGIVNFLCLIGFRDGGLLLCSSQALRSVAIQDQIPGSIVLCIRVYKRPASLWYLKLEGHVIERCTLSTLYTSVSHFIDTVLEVSVTNSAMVSGQMRAVSKGLDTT